MKIIEKIAAKAKDNMNNRGVTIAFLGDSVTQGCFELYWKNNGDIETVFDKNSAYHMYIQKIFSVLYPTVPINVINAGISGDKVQHGYERLEEDVIRYSPDLTVVCFALNDCGKGKDNLPLYGESLRKIFKRLREINSEIIFMTPNMMCTEVSPHIADEKLRKVAADVIDRQESGMFDMYLDEAKKACAEYDVTVCDCHAKWKKLYENGVNVTELLANKINHPAREMNWLFAFSLIETMFN